MIFGKYAAIGGAVAIGVLWPFATGQIGQSLYEKEIGQIHSPYVTVTNTSYERGYLSSNVVTQVNITGAMQSVYMEQGLPTSYTILTEMDHGFLGIGSISVLEMTPEVVAVTQALWPGDESPITVVADTSLFGDTQYDVTVRAMEASNEEFSVVSSPANIGGLVDKDGNIVFDLEMPAFGVTTLEGETFNFDRITGSGQGKMVDEMWVGVQQYNVGSSEFGDSYGQPLTISNLATIIKNDLTAVNGGKIEGANKDDLRIDSINTLSFQQMAIPDAFSLENFQVGFNFYQLDYSSLLTLATTSESMGDEPSEEDITQLVNALDRIVEQGLTFEILPFAVDTPEGHIDGKFDLNVAPGLGSVTQNIGALSSKLSGNLALSLPSAYLQQVPELAAAVENIKPYGFITETEALVTLSAKIEGDQAVSATGERIPLGLLAMMFM